MQTPPNVSPWQGRDDTAVEGPDALRIHQCIKPWTPESPPGVCLLGFECDEGVRRNQGRVGAVEGPVAIRKALGNLAWDVGRPLFDAGNVCCVDADLEGAQKKLGDVVATILRSHQRLIVLGGGHETAWGSFLGLTTAVSDAAVGVINLDAHFDLRTSPTPHSGTAFRQIAEWFQRHDRPVRISCLGIAEPSNTTAAFRAARDLGVHWKCDRDAMFWDFMPTDLSERKRVLDDADYVHLSIDLDVLPASVMPAVSAPAGGGVLLEVIESLIDTVIGSGKASVVDIVEFNPRYDPDGLAVRTAARVVWRVARRWSEVDRT